MDPGSLLVFSRVAAASLLSVLPRRRRRLLDVDRSSPGAPVFVMLPLDAFSPECGVDLASALPRLSAAGVHGIMVDVWWGICEPRPRQYDFGQYKRIAELCRTSGLKMQATISLHACGGNVGDTVNIPLPAWVLAAGDANDLWYMDRAGFKHRECLSLSADKLKVLPTRLVNPSSQSSSQQTHPVADDIEERSGEPDPMRTALEAYRDFMSAFVEEMGTDLIGSTIVELQVGCGPCGELRYPSYPLGSGMWTFPGMGEFQCFDRHMLADLEDQARSGGYPADWGVPPGDTGSYNAKPRSCSFFRTKFRSPKGKFFLKWYAEALLGHGENMLETASKAIGKDSKLTLAVKISGIHWWKLSPSRASEATAGYTMSGGFNFYKRIADLLSQYNAVLDFTCLEMRTWDQPFLSARCGPRQLVAEVFGVAERAGVRVAGENALERYDQRAYSQIVTAYESIDPRNIYGFTFLRLGKTLLEESNFQLFEGFVRSLSNVGK